MASRFPSVALPDSPYAREVQRICLALPDAWEDYPWGDIVYKVSVKMFAGTGPHLPVAVTVKATPEDAGVLTQLPHISRAKYVGKYGWVSVVVEDDAAMDQLRELIVTSYEMVRKAGSPGQGRKSRLRRTRPESGNR
jgi:predicted DNA-binding protein (MmcQ/YjbR family)